jgi:hypothetical protein
MTKYAQTDTSSLQKYEENPKQQKVSWKKCFWGPFIYSDLTTCQAELNGLSASG